MELIFAAFHQSLDFAFYHKLSNAIFVFWTARCICKCTVYVHWYSPFLSVTHWEIVSKKVCWWLLLSRNHNWYLCWFTGCVSGLGWLRSVPRHPLGGSSLQVNRYNVRHKRYNHGTFCTKFDTTARPRYSATFNLPPPPPCNIPCKMKLAVFYDVASFFAIFGRVSALIMKSCV